MLTNQQPMKTLIAKTTLTGDYGHVEAGDKFKAEDDQADSLIERELAEASTGKVAAIEGSSMTDDDDLTATEKAGGKKVPDDAGTQEDKADQAAANRKDKTDQQAAARQTKTDKTVTTDNQG